MTRDVSPPRASGRDWWAPCGIDDFLVLKVYSEIDTALVDTGAETLIIYGDPAKLDGDTNNRGQGEI